MHRFLFLTVLFMSTCIYGVQLQFPQLTGHVVDDAKILDISTQHDLDEELRSLEEISGIQLVVVTMPTLDGYPLEEYGYQLGRYWEIGQKGKDNGVIFLVIPKDRQVRIEVGYGLEQVLTDAVTKIIIERIILPQFKKGDLQQGIVAGTQRILSYLRADIAPEPPAQSVSNPFIDIAFPLIAVLIIFVISFGCKRTFRGGGSGGGNWSGGGSSGSFGGGGGSFGGGGSSGRW